MGIFKTVRRGFCLVTLLIVGGIGLCFGLFAAIFGGVFFLTQPVVTAGDTLMTGLREQNYADAYAVLADPARSELGSSERLGSWARENNFTPQSWSYNSRRIENQRGYLSGSATLTNGGERRFSMDLTVVDGEWRITRIQLN